MFDNHDSHSSLFWPKDLQNDKSIFSPLYSRPNSKKDHIPARPTSYFELLKICQSIFSKETILIKHLKSNFSNYFSDGQLGSSFLSLDSFSSLHWSNFMLFAFILVHWSIF